MSKYSKQTSNKVAKLASEVLRDPSSSAIQKKLAGSALAQTHSSKQTGNEMESEASRVLKSDKYNDMTKTLAASLVSQSNKER
ncbi:TPA: hypothetical protein OXO37_002119 [Acinetobacter baumannii]|nr:hypothetical protein [Acinetobacter baumannii]